MEKGCKSSWVRWAEGTLVVLEMCGLVRTLFGSEALGQQGIISSPSETEKVNIGTAWEWCGGQRLVREVGGVHKALEVLEGAHWAVEVLADVDGALAVEDDHVADRMELQLEVEDDHVVDRMELQLEP